MGEPLSSYYLDRGLSEISAGLYNHRRTYSPDYTWILSNGTTVTRDAFTSLLRDALTSELNIIHSKNGPHVDLDTFMLAKSYTSMYSNIRSFVSENVRPYLLLDALSDIVRTLLNEIRGLNEESEKQKPSSLLYEVVYVSTKHSLITGETEASYLDDLINALELETIKTIYGLDMRYIMFGGHINEQSTDVIR